MADARRFVRRVLAEWEAEELEDRVVQVLSELATNSVIHARSGFTVELSLEEAVVRLCVSDASSHRPVRKVRSTQATTGRGLALVQALGDSWGIDPNGGGKTVWVMFGSEDGGRGGVTGRGAPLHRLPSPDDPLGGEAGDAPGATDADRNGGCHARWAA